MGDADSNKSSLWQRHLTFKKRQSFLFIAVLMMTILMIDCFKEDPQIEEDLQIRQLTSQINETQVFPDIIRKKREMDDFNGHVCFGVMKGYLSVCNIRINFTRQSNVRLNVTIGPKHLFSWTKGTHTQDDDKFGSWDHIINEVAYLSVVIHGDVIVNWSGDLAPNTPGLTVTKDGETRTKVLYTEQVWYKFLQLGTILQNNISNTPIVWKIQAFRDSKFVNVEMAITVTDLIIPNIEVFPNSIEILEGRDQLVLTCSIESVLSPESLMTWTKGDEFLGSFSNANPSMIHRGLVGRVEWSEKRFTYHQDRPTLNDNGNYQCCLRLKNFERKCVDVNVTVISPTISVCENKVFKESSPFQVNYLHSKPLLLDGKFITIIWNFNISEWKISSRFPQCKKYL
ncbi:uncharacterized protein LOC128502141 [Spea bombifrons]|uniref:uncharacterized protein LOC128502141 n=1 Tax=Spea bombifrons TaxID=233779 RepID=UPI00234B3524|nr:uncharacterized protein LOC128502141 [Spea bombifrons]